VHHGSVLWLCNLKDASLPLLSMCTTYRAFFQSYIHTCSEKQLQSCLCKQVLSSADQSRSCIALVSHATPFEFGQGLADEDLKVAVDAINNFLLQLRLSATPPTPPTCATEAVQQLLLPQLWYTPSPQLGMLLELRTAISDANSIVASPTDDSSSFLTRIVPYPAQRSIRFEQHSTVNPDQLLTGLPAADVLTIVRPPLWLLLYCTAMLAVLLGGWACWGLSSVTSVSSGSGIMHVLTAATSLVCAFLTVVFSTEKVLMIDNDEWCLWKAIAWLPVEWTANPERGDTCELIGALVRLSTATVEPSPLGLNMNVLRDLTSTLLVVLTSIYLGNTTPISR
jgi:hypothetical protein